MSRTNLLEETIEDLSQHNKTIDDIRWIGSPDCQIPLEDMIKLFDVFYDNGYGGAEIALDLLVVGDDWWLERHEYDGSEWWEYKQLPVKPTKVKPISKVHDACWDGLDGILENRGRYD